jgi:hypothetical protein
MQRIESKRHAPQGQATRETAVQTAVFRGAFTSNAMQGIEAQSRARHRSEKQIGLAIGSSGFPDVFSHQRQSRAGQCIAKQLTAKQSKSGWQLATAALPMCFHINRNGLNRSAEQSTATQRKAPRPGHWKQCPRQVVLTHSAWEPHPFD